MGSWGSIDPGESTLASNYFTITAENTIINGSNLTIDLDLNNADGYSRTEPLHIKVGDVSETDPLGPDNHGYYIFDSGDLGYNNAPFYDWIEIDPNEGGNGVDIQISDGGNGNNISNSTKYIDLPFDFSFYGETYDEVSVNSNGWISFGHTNMESFRNYPIPGAGGPSPMIAAFWDDLETGSSGDVYYEEFNDYVVIEWSDMRTQNNNSLETFQIILYDNSAQPYGDNEIKIQYKEFNNTSDGYYPEGGAPQHGCYSTIGIENKYANQGLQYTFNNQYSAGASVLSDGEAIFITTTPPFIFYGDVNGDEILNVLDVVILVNMVLGGIAQDMIGDMNQDEILNILDVVILVSIVLGG